MALDGSRRTSPEAVGGLRLTLVRVGYALGCGSAAVGVFLLFGLAWVLIVAGVIVAGTSVLLADDA